MLYFSCHCRLCRVSTFESEAWRTSRMIVFGKVPFAEVYNAHIPRVHIWLHLFLCQVKHHLSIRHS